MYCDLNIYFEMAMPYLHVSILHNKRSMTPKFEIQWTRNGSEYIVMCNSIQWILHRDVLERVGGDSLLIMFPHFTSKYTECTNLFWWV